MSRPIKGLLPLLLLIATMCLAPQSALCATPAGEVVHEDRFDAAQLRWVTQADGTLAAEMPNTRLVPVPGRAMLPSRELLLLVPADRRVADVVVEPLATTLVKVPGQLALATDVTTSTGGRLGANDVAAALDKRATGAWISGWSTHVWRGYQLLAVAVTPLRVLPGEGGACEFLADYAVRVNWADGAGPDIAQRERLVAGEARENRQVLERLVANPGAVASMRRVDGVAVSAPGAFSPDKTPSLTGSPVTCLIITNSALAASFQVLADYRTARGMPTVVATREYIAANYRNGSDIQETMRMYIRDAYTKWGVQYVLLGGDSDVLPPRMIDNSLYPPNGYTSIPCDLYFACLDGNWNADGDAWYGQPAKYEAPGDLVDFASEVYIGRAPVSSVADAVSFVQKVINYESVPAGTLWPGRTLFAAEVLFPEDYATGDAILLDGASYANEQVTTLIDPCTDMQVLRMYQTDALYPRDLPLTRAALIDSLNGGNYGIVNQIGHGYFFNMSVGDANFMTTDADNLVNGTHQFFLFGLNCASAAFDNSCLMERFVQNPDGGAVCAVGSTREAFPTAANSYQQEFFRNFYCVGENRIGRLQALSRLPWLANTESNYLDRWTYENYTLLGDPALALWSSVPRTAAVTAPTSIAAGQRTVSVTVTDGGVAVAGALVCLAKPNEELVYGTTDATGTVALSALLPSAGTATLIVTGHNLATVTRSIPVTLSGRYLKVTAMPFVDNGTAGSIGNGNGVIDAGERIAFSPTYLNTGTTSATSLRGALTTTATGVTVVTANVALSNAAAGAVTAATTPILVDFAGTMPDGHPVTFKSDAYSGTTHWYSEYTVPVNAPQPEVTSLDWQDAAFGNANGVQENGERLAVTVDVKNFGAGASGVLTGRLRTVSPNVTVQDSVATWTSLGLLGHGTASTVFSLTVADTALAAPAWVVLQDGYGRKVRHDFTLGRPVPPTQLEASTSLGPSSIQLLWTPSASADVYGYNIFRAPAVAGPYTRINPDVVARVSTYVDSGLPLLTPFHYRIVAVDSSRVPSGYSTTISCSTAPAEKAGFPAPFDGETSGPLAVGDIDGDNDLEIVLASGQVYAWHHNGTEVRNGDGVALTLGQFSNFPDGTLLELAAVTLADIDGLPGAEIIVSERTPVARIHAFKADGTEVPGWPRAFNGPSGSSFNWAAPAVGDIDGDHLPEVVVHTLNGVIWAWNGDGTEVIDGDANPASQGVLYVREGAQWEWSRSGPTLVDLDHDGARDIVFGTKNDASGIKRLMAMRWNGTFLPGFPKQVNAGINVDIAAGDVDRDGVTELVTYDAQRWVYVVHEDGTDYPGFPVRMPYTSSNEWATSPALADLDGDGKLEVIYTPNATGLSAKLVVVSTNTADGTSGQVKAGWPVDLPGSSEASPVVGDLDGDGVPEIVQGIGGGDVGAPYNLYVYHADGQPMNGFPITLTGPVRTSPVITDIEGDQDVDLVYGGWDFLCHIWDLPYAYDGGKVPWPTYKGDMKRDGVYSAPGVSGVGPLPAVPAAAVALDRPYPNPFNPSVSVRLYVDATRPLTLGVYDVRGHLVRTLHQGPAAAGWRTVVWDGRDDKGVGAASGVYFLRAESPGAAAVTRKMMLVK